MEILKRREPLVIYLLEFLSIRNHEIKKMKISLFIIEEILNSFTQAKRVVGTFWLIDIVTHSSH